jgi:hypothetical protein
MKKMFILAVHGPARRSSTRTPGRGSSPNAFGKVPLSRAITLIFLLAACHKPGGVEEAIAKMNEAADKTCKCATIECARHVRDDLQLWINAHASEHAKLKSTDEEERQITAAQRRTLECDAKLLH